MTIAADCQPIVLVPGLNCSPRLYEGQLSALWQLGPVTIADHRRDETLSAIARRILDCAPKHFSLAGLSMGGYISFEIVRQAPERVMKLALLDTSARPEAPEQTERRKKLIELAEQNRLIEINDVLWPVLVHRSKLDNEALRAIIDRMALETGAEAFIRQQKAIIGRADLRPLLGTIKCPTIMIVGDSDQLTPPAHAKEIVEGIPGACLEVISSCGHMSTMEQSQQITKLLVDFFAH